MSKLDSIGKADGWRCWLCDEPVNPQMSVNDPRGPSIDARVANSKAKQAGPFSRERLAHRACNTKKGAVDAVVHWSDGLFVVDPAPIIPATARLQRKRGREVMARCPTRADADAAAAWLADRCSRLCPELAATTAVESGGGQFLVVLTA